MKTIVFILLTVLLGSCRTIQYIPVESVKTDSIYINKVKRDSLIVKDSIFVHDRGDTVYINKYKYIYSDRLVLDTILVNSVDTIRVPYPVERELTFWEKTKQSLYFIIVTVLIVIGIFVIGRVKRLLK